MNSFYNICCLIPFFLCIEIYYLYKIKTNTAYIYTKTLFNIILISVLLIFMNVNTLYNHLFIPITTILYHVGINIYFHLKFKKIRLKKTFHKNNQQSVSFFI